MRSAWLAVAIVCLIGATLPLWHLYFSAKKITPSDGTASSSGPDKRSGALFVALALALHAILCALIAFSPFFAERPFAARNAVSSLIVLLSVAEPLLLCAGFFYASPLNSTKAKSILVVDSLIFGAASTALAWWLLIERTSQNAAPVTVVGFFAASFAISTAFAISLYGYPLQDRENRSLPATLAFRVGTLGLALGFILLWQDSTSPGIAVTAVWGIGALVIGFGSFLDNRLHVARLQPALALAVSNNRYSVYAVPLTLILPCAALFTGLMHLGSAHRTLGSVPRYEMWWAPMLIVAAVGRCLWTWMHEGYADDSAGRGLSQENRELREQINRRTHQLSTLHAITAELNDTLDSEKLLISSLDRMRESVNADSAAVWLRLGDVTLTDQSGSNDSMVSNASALLRDIERGAAERRAIESLKRNRDGNGEESTHRRPGDTYTAHRWRTVHRLDGNPEMQRILEMMHGQLEMGDLTAAADFCEAKCEGCAHISAIRWKGEVIGAIGITRLEHKWESAELSLLDALALEMGVALQNAQLYQEASRLADRDALTDLLNHRALQQQLTALLSRARRIPTEFSVVMMDVKNFQFFNSTYGHPVGDKVLRTVAQCLRDACRTSDILGRYGGDEFIAILLDTDITGTQEVCSRIAKRVEQESFQVTGDGRRIPIGLSFGISLHPQDGADAMELLGTSNANLSESKNSGITFVFTDKAQQAQEVRQLKDVSVGGSFGVLDALVTAIDNKDRYTRRHSEDVSHWATLMSRYLQHSEELQRAVTICGLLHDVGKIAVPDAILRKPGRLQDDEFLIMQQHPVFGALIVKDVPNLTDVLGGIRHHHERFDGKGYPDKLKGESIPLLGRMLAVPDCFSAMTTERPYRKALTWSEAISEIEKGRGTQFDPEMADAFLEVIAQLISEKNAAERAELEEDVASDENGKILRPRSVMDAEVTAS